MTTPFTSNIKCSADVLFRMIGDEAVLLNLKTELYLGLDPVGSRMWQLLTTSPSLQAAYDALLQEYEVLPDRLRQDLDRFVGDLLEQSLIEIRSEPMSAGLSK